MIEAEIKARLVDPGQVRGRLDAAATGTPETYRDTYFDTPEGSLSAEDRELRVRTVTGPDGVRHLLTLKDGAVDAVTRSKPEVELLVGDPQAAGAVLIGLGYPAGLAFTKHCVNYELARGGRRFLATVVTVPEIDGTFLEVETLAASEEVDAALAAVRDLLGELGVDEAQWTTDTYTDAVRAARRRPGRPWPDPRRTNGPDR